MVTDAIPAIGAKAGRYFGPAEVRRPGDGSDSASGLAGAESGAALPPPPSSTAVQRRLVVVSNRVGPIDRNKAGHGGLAVAIRAALEQVGGIWFGFSGTIAGMASVTINRPRP